jgi:hypothetical protein
VRVGNSASALATLLAIAALAAACAPRQGRVPSLASLQAQYHNERPECGDAGKLTERLYWPEQCLGLTEEEVAWHLECIVPQSVAQPSPGGCELEDTVEEGLEDRGL